LVIETLDVGADGAGFEYGRSAVVMIGTSQYTELPPVPAAANSLRRMHGLLTGPLCGWPEDRVCVRADERVPGGLPDLLVRKFSAATDIALFYYVGHGQPDRHDRLCLGLVESVREPERRYTTSLAFDAVRDAMRTSPARFKVILLDCCYSGMAIHDNTLGPGGEYDVTGQVRGSGAYVIAACGPYDKAWYEDEPANPHPLTNFTKCLAETVEAGDADGSTVLTLGQLADRLIDNLGAARKPLPTTLVRDQARALPFARYARHREPVVVPAGPAAPTAPAAPDLPAPIVYRVDPDLPAGGGTGAAAAYPDVPVGVWRDPDLERRTLALLRIGLDLAETDRGQARRVFAAAERAAHEVADGYPRFHLLIAAARQARRPAPKQARRFLGLAAACAAELEDQPLVHQRALETLKDLHGSLPD
jgi:hypothetical protein